MLILIIIAYLAIGAFFGVNRLSKGIHGSVGPFLTFVAWMLLWPLQLITSRF